jgi:CO dehydrogenase nickel-insertion accessory protein CooC1
VADFEAGLGTVLRLGRDPDDVVHVDVVVVVVEPTATSLEVGRRAAEAVTAAGIGRVVVTANRIRSDDDAGRVRAAFPEVEPVLVPEDPAVVAAEREGAAPLDAAEGAPAVRALVGLADSLLRDG